MLATTIAAAQHEGATTWWARAVEQSVGSYWFKTDLPKPQAKRLARHMNTMFREYDRRLSRLPPRAPQRLNVLMFRTRDDYERTLQARFNIDASGSGGMSFGTPQGTGLAFWTEDLSSRRVQHVMQHEGFHQFAASRFGTDLPMWINEGLAELFGQAIAARNGLILGQRPTRVVEPLRRAVERDEYVPFREMLSMNPVRWNERVRGRDAAMLYDQAWSMVHFLVYAEQGRWRSDFERYLRLINGGTESDAAFREAFGTDDVDAFEQRWRDYVLAMKPSAFITAVDRIERIAAGMSELRRSDALPDSLEQLRTALAELDTSSPPDRFGGHAITGEVGYILEIPGDELTTGAAPAFELRPFDARRLPLRERRREQTDPTPPSIATVNLKPHDIEIVWTRTGEPGLFRHEMRIRQR